LIKDEEKRDLNHFESEMFDSLQYDPTRSALQYELNSFATMDTYWVPDVPDIKAFSHHLWHSILMFAK